MAKKGTLTVSVIGDTKPFEDALGKISKTAGIAFAAVGTAAIAGAAKSLMAFTDFQGQMNEVFTLLPGISQSAMDDMSGSVKSFSKEFGVLPDKVVPALYQALSAGVPKDNVFDFLEVAQKAAKGGVTELETAVDGISSVVNAYGDDVVSAAQASDLMFTAVRLGKTNFEELSASLSNVTPIASGLGVKFEDVSAGLAALTAKGTPTAQATTQLRSLFVDLSKAGGKTAKVFEGMAGKTFQEFIAGGGSTSDALDIMRQAAEKSGVQIQDLFGSVEAGSAALSLAADSTFAENIDAMGESAGATQAAFDQMMTGLGPVFDKVKAGIAVFLIDVGEKLAPVVEDAIERVSAAFADVGPVIQSFVEDVLGNLSKWWEDNGPTIIDIADKLRDGLVSAFEGMVRAVQFVVRNWDKFKIAVAVAVGIMIPHFVALGVQAVISAAKQVAAWAASNAAAIAGAVVHSAQVAIMVAKWVFMGAQSLLHAAKVAAAWLIAMGPIALVIAAVVGLVVVIVKNWDTIKSVIAAGWDWVKRTTATAWDAIKSTVSKVVGAVVGFVTGIPGRISGVVSTMWDGIKTNFETVRSFIGDKIEALVTTITGLPGRITRAASGLFDGFKDAFRSALNWIIDKWNGLSFTLPTVEAFGATIGGNTFRPPRIPRLATGGVVSSPTLALVGDAGIGNPEIVAPEQMLRRIMREERDGGSTTINVTVHAGMGTNGADVGRQIVDALRSFERSNGRVFAPA